MGCCKYHQSLFTYGAIIASILAWFLSLASPAAFGIGFFAMSFTFFTMCCRVHRFVLLFIMLLALVCMILDFIAAAKGDREYCEPNTTNCQTANGAILGSVSGLLWLFVAVCLYKIPTTGPNDSDGNEMVGISTASPQARSSGSHDVV